MAERRVPLPVQIIKKSNAIARASWSVKSVYEPRLVALVASRVRTDDLDFQDYEIPISELVGGATDGRTRQLVSDAVDGLLGRVLTLPRPNGWAKCTLFSYVEFDGKEGVIRARFDPSLKEHYLQLRSHFTEYSLMEFLLLPSTYSQRLFEILKSWANLPEVVISLSDLFRMLDVPGSFQRYPDFRRKVLERAHKDITSSTGLRYAWEPIKKGRAVDSIHFIFGKRSKNEKEAQELENKKLENKKRNEILQKALLCYADKGDDCTPKNTNICKMCLHLVKNYS